MALESKSPGKINKASIHQFASEQPTVDVFAATAVARAF